MQWYHISPYKLIQSSLMDVRSLISIICSVYTVSKCYWKEIHLFKLFSPNKLDFTVSSSFDTQQITFWSASVSNSIKFFWTIYWSPAKYFLTAQWIHIGSVLNWAGWVGSWWCGSHSVTLNIVETNLHTLQKILQYFQIYSWIFCILFQM